MLNSDVKALLSTLRESHLDWMADEVEESIHAGKKQVKDLQGINNQHGENMQKDCKELGFKDLSEVTTTIPYTAAEELGISLKTLTTYFVDLSLIWERATNMFKEQFAVETIVADADGKPIVPFTEGYYTERMNLKELLAKAVQAE